MAANGHLTKDDTSTQFTKRFSKFVTTFVDHFEGKLDQYCKTSEGKLHKMSKRGTVLEYFVTTVFAGLGVLVGHGEAFGKVGHTGGRLLGKYFGTKHHEDRANNIHANIGLAAAETVRLRATLVEAASEIFQSFEMQFMTMGSDKGWHKAMQDLAQDAVERIVSYTSKRPIHNITPEVLTEAFLLGKPKVRRSIDPSPHIVIFEGVPCKILNFYEKAWLRVPGNPDMFYKGKGVDMKYGFRYIFKWEYKDLLQYDTYEPKCSVEYKFLLQDHEFMDKKMVELLDGINEHDPNFKLDSIYKGVGNWNNWMAKILNSLGSVLEQLKRSQETTAVDSGSRKRGFVFNPQKPIDRFTARDDWLEEDRGELHKAFQNHEIVTIVGPGGVGKTELARKYAAISRESYDGNIIWINCSVQGNIFISLRQLEKKIRKRETAHSMFETQTLQHDPFLVRQVYGYFRDKKCLFIFDDVQQYRDIQSVLLQASTLNTARILITCRQELDQHFHTISLKPFSPEEAREFLKESVEDEIETLETVGRSPLALQMVAACMEEKRRRQADNPNAEISNYVEKYVREINEDTDDNILRGVVSLTLELIGQEELGGQTALKVLRFLTFYSPENIPSGVVSKLFDPRLSPEECEQVENLLKKYSVITLPAKNKWNLHRVVQETIKLSFSEEEEREALTATLRSLSPQTPEEHVLAVWESASRHVDLVSEFKSCSYGGEVNSILHLCAKNGHGPPVNKLLKAFPDENSKKDFLNLCNRSGNSAIHLAAKNGFIKIVKQLRNQVADVEIKNKMQRTPFHESIAKGQLHVVEYFADNIDCSAENEENCNMVHWAAASGNVQVVKYLVEVKNANFSKLGMAQTLPIHEACKGNKQDIVEYLLNRPGADPEVQDIVGNSPLHIAAQYGHMQLVKYLVEEKKVKISPTNKLRKTPAHCAVRSGKEDILAYFLNNEPTTDLQCAKNKYSLWHEAAYSGQLDILKYLAKNYASPPHYRMPINLPDKFGNTLLHEACSGGHINVVRYLVETHRAKVDAVNKHGKLPIHRAALNGKLNIVKYFIEDQKMNVDIKVDGKGSPLHEATYGGHLSVIAFLLEEGANIEECNEYQRTPLFGAVKNKHGNTTNLEVMKYLVDKKHCRIDIKDYKGLTPLEYAREKNNHEAVKYLEARQTV